MYEWYPRDPVNAPSLAPLLEPHTDTSSESESDQDDDDDDGDSNDQDDQIPGTGPPDIGVENDVNPDALAVYGWWDRPTDRTHSLATARSARCAAAW